MSIHHCFTFSDILYLDYHHGCSWTPQSKRLFNFTAYLEVDILKILEPARRVQTLTEFAMKEGFQLNPHGDNMVRVGVDVRYGPPLLSSFLNKS